MITEHSTVAHRFLLRTANPVQQRITTALQAAPPAALPPVTSAVPALISESQSSERAAAAVHTGSPAMPHASCRHLLPFSTGDTTRTHLPAQHGVRLADTNLPRGTTSLLPHGKFTSRVSRGPYGHPRRRKGG